MLDVMSEGYRDKAERPPLNPLDRRWYTKQGDNEKGPFSEEALVRAVLANKLRRSTLVRGEGETDWRSMSDVPELQRQMPSVGAPRRERADEAGFVVDRGASRGMSGHRIALLVVLGVLGTLGFGFLLLVLLAHGMGSPGRPLRVAGRRLLPRVLRAGRLPAAEHPGPDDPDPARVPKEVRPLLARMWLADARAEHASVTVFEHLALDLGVAGAPDRLVAWACRAAIEEAGHATLCFAVASTYAGRDLRASTAPFAGDWRPRAESRRDLVERLALESLLDGCIEEGVAAESARMGAADAIDPAIRRVLDRIAREESGHAELAHAILEWAVLEEPSVLPTLWSALERSRRRLRRPLIDTESLLRHGRLSGVAAVTLAHAAHDAAADVIGSRLRSFDEARRLSRPLEVQGHRVRPLRGEGLRPECRKVDAEGRKAVRGWDDLLCVLRERPGEPRRS
jgi:hypothetical protein